MDRDVRRRGAPERPAGPARDSAAETDEALMARFRDGEAAAFDALLDRHKRPLFAFLRRSTPTAADAEDVFQEVFLKVIKAAPRWEPQARFTTWLYTVARHALIDAARRRGARPREVSLTAGEGDDDAPQAPIERLAAPGPDADRALLEREHGDAVEALVAALPAEQREAFLLKREGLTFEQIAEATGTPRNTVKSRLRYALDKLRTGLERRGLLGGAP